MYILPFAHLRHLFSVVMSTSRPQKRDNFCRRAKCSAPKLSISIIKLILITYLSKIHVELSLLQCSDNLVGNGFHAGY